MGEYRTMDGLLRYASQADAFSYFGVIILIAVLECVVPRRRPGDTLPLRWFGNVAITILNTIVVRAVFPIAAIAWAALCSERSWGLLNAVASPTAVEFVIAILALDLLLYGQHYLLHRVSLLWRLHRTHHSDPEYDLTTGLRFHPLEMLFSTALLLAALVIIGAAPAAVLVSQLMSTAINFIEHANVRVPAWFDRLVRLVFVTPDMHRVHHSSAPGESRANFSNTFSWWDRLFGTYVAQPAAGHDAMEFGLFGFEERKHLTLPWMLAQPFMADPESFVPQSSSTAVLSRRGARR
jgi:sterol desaturase/sphingolipid hydroxylase (fatty acid hydroxylase superfamily)